jgi:hypothetical protein
LQPVPFDQAQQQVLNAVCPYLNPIDRLATFPL